MIKRKKLGGFTLVEIIVALAVFAVMSLIVALIIQMSSKIIKDSQNTTAKAHYHSLIAHRAISNANNSDYTGIVGDYDTIFTPDGCNDPDWPDPTPMTIELNGATLDKVVAVVLEGKDPYNDDSDLQDKAGIKASPSDVDGFYEHAPGIKVFTNYEEP